MDIKKWFLPLLGILVFSTVAYGASVGAIPGFVDFEEVERGESATTNVYVTTNFGENFTVSPEIYPGRKSIMFRESREEQDETSEKDVSRWFSVENDVSVSPNNSSAVDLEGGVANVEGGFELTLNVPSDAEPGYHYARLNLNPDIDTGDGAGTVNWGETLVDIRFRVSGDAVREITAQDVRAFRTDEGRATVEILLSNSGTVTTSIDSFKLDILDRSRNRVAELEVSSSSLAPGESEWAETTWIEPDSIEEGSYQVDGDVNYITGNAVASGSFSLPGIDVIEVQPEENVDVSSEELPLWLVLMVLIVLGVLMWSFEIDPVWIFSIVGLLGISAFILFTGISNLLLVALLLPAVLIIYMV